MRPQAIIEYGMQIDPQLSSGKTLFSSKIKKTLTRSIAFNKSSLYLAVLCFWMNSKLEGVSLLILRLQFDGTFDFDKSSINSEIIIVVRFLHKLLDQNSKFIASNRNLKP